MTDMDGNIKGRWKEFQGIEDNWAALLKAPELDNDFRRSILVYGNMVAASVDSLAGEDPRDCLFDKESFMSGVGLVKGNKYEYEVTKYIYTTATPLLAKPSTRYGGYVAVSNDNGTAVLGRRDIVVAWSGSITCEEYLIDLDLYLTDPELGNDVVGKVHGGFHNSYTKPNPDSPFGDMPSARNQVLEEVKRLVGLYQDKREDISITLTGHSLGAALATLCSIDIVANKYNQPSNNSGKQIPVTVITFAGPRVGDSKFAECYDGARGGGNLNLLRVTGKYDPVPDRPKHQDYTHCGVNVAIDATESTDLNPIYVKPDPNTKMHELEVYCHGVAGTQNKGGFSLQVHRQVDLINKHLDILKNPTALKNWWNKHPPVMVQCDDGTWVPV